MAKKHFPGTGACKIHTARGPACDKKCAYKKAAAVKYAYQPQAAHHVIPVATFVDYQVDDDFEDVAAEITKVYKATDYCANQAANLIDLPRKTTYIAGKKKLAGTVWASNLPCHNWDHHAYNQEVIEELRARIWSKFKPKKPPVPCPDENAVATAFAAIEGKFRTQLTVTCPMRAGGTLAAIQGANAKPPLANWWHSFSMAMTVRDEPVFAFAKDSGVPAPLQR